MATRLGAAIWIDSIPYGWYVFPMTRTTKHSPERGSARTRLLEAARDTIRAKGFAATTVDDLCKAADVTKGAFFHHFKTKEALGVAAAEFWTETTGALFEAAPYHAAQDPLDRVLGYLDFRRAIISDDIPAFTCLVGTLTQEIYDTAPEIRDAAAAMADRGITAARWTPASLARHFQAVLQGGFILAKAGNDPELARESIDHLKCYVRHLFGVPTPLQKETSK